MNATYIHVPSFQIQFETKQEKKSRKRLENLPRKKVQLKGVR